MYLRIQSPICELKDVILQKKAGKEMCLVVLIDWKMKSQHWMCPICSWFVG